VIAPADYQFLTQLLQRTSGLALGPGREYLVESRLTPVAVRFGVPDVAALVARVRATHERELVRAVCEAMATHESSFFRDDTPFTLLRESIVPELLSSRRASRRLRVWCAAASTGQEPYSVAMLLDGMGLAVAGWSVEIVATDFSGAALERARQGVFSDFEVQRGLSPELLGRCFVREGTGWRINDTLRRAVSFRELNLLTPFGSLGTFDLVLCRNVLIYFDVPTKQDVLDRLAATLAPDGYLLLGAAETVTGLTERLVRVPDATGNVFRRAASAPMAIRLAS
jgi:chemotaxis protein methyltransferase CheR